LNSERPSGASAATNASLPVPVRALWKAPARGKSSEAVSPVSQARPDASTAMPAAASVPDPPISVEYANAAPDSFVTKPSPGPRKGWIGLRVGKSSDAVTPAE
jgi:hypothetical protein